MPVTITIHLEVEDEETLKDIITILETTLPYVADNAVVISKTEGDPPED